MMSYALAAMSAEEISVTLIDPRGQTSRPALSIFPLTRAWIELMFLGLAHRVDVAHINISSHGSSIRKPALLWTCRLLGIPVVLHLHASEYPEFFDSLPRFAKALLRRTFSSATRVLVLGATWKDYVCRELHVPEDKVTVLLNASPGPRSHTSSERGAESLRILFLGRLGARKGLPEILAALADHRVSSEPWAATLAGDGDVALYRREVDRLGLSDRVTLTGWVSSADAEQLLAESHLLLLPSHAEGLPMSIIEAFAHGVPVVSTPVGAIPDIVEPGRNGLLVDAGNGLQLADAILAILGDESLRLQLAQNARRTWEQRLDITSYVHELALHWRLASTGMLEGSPRA
jgi:glycosyltransferase involved in cell wall biosynthesis